ncbi:MAG: FHA domain-containing protein [Planctomycetaceae bacterium]|nr:FHA domain-containing protein [Planctomycetaceae bacterium]
MSAFLIPSSGGDAVPLRKSRIYLGRCKTADPAAPPGRDTALVLIELLEGWWYVEDLRSPKGVRVNGVFCKKQKLAPNDEIEIGSQRFRIDYETPKYRFGRKTDGDFQVVTKTASGSSRPIPRTGGVLGRLVPLGGGPDFALTKTRVTIGRRTPCDVVIERSTISSRHCELEFIEGHWFARDLDSRNGIRINGERTQEGWVLANGRLTIADQRYQLDYMPSGPTPIGAGPAVSTDRSLMEQIGMADGDLDRMIAREEEKVDPGAQRRRWSLTDD